MKRLRRRVAAVKEILSTEEQYVSKLRLFENVFFTALREAQNAALINPSDIASIICNWDDLLIYNTELLRQLRARGRENQMEGMIFFLSNSLFFFFSFEF